jgi:hypothetical protein
VGRQIVGNRILCVVPLTKAYATNVNSVAKILHHTHWVRIPNRRLKVLEIIP